MDWEMPVWHWVPTASAWTADHCPLAQRWKELLPMQFQLPSWPAQAVPGVMAEPPTIGLGATELAAGATVATDDLLGTETTGGAEVTVGEADETGTVTNTPPGRPAVEVAALVEVATGAKVATGADVATGAAATVVVGAVPTLAWQEPVGS